MALRARILTWARRISPTAPAFTLSKEGQVEYWRSIMGGDVPKNCLFSFMLFGIGDMFAQKIDIDEKTATMEKTEKTEKAPDTNWFEQLNMRRLLAVSSCGILLNGCVLTPFYHGLDFFLGAATRATYWPLVPIKVVLTQIVYMPVSAVLFHFTTLFLQTFNFEAGVQNVQAKLLDTYITGWCFWAPLDLFTFLLLTPNQRVYFDGSADIIWNTYLSWKAHSDKGDSFIRILFPLNA
eukprot:GEMP01047709.1.p1 GENE.GEMP01047709.1~~GEMP01047709.1.p1  ORF type:complete len:237 (+),score=30.13 GEMP01047709.1:203-913(+)